MSLAAIGYYYNQVNATYAAVKCFREFYPDSTLVMINDGGKDAIATIAKEFDAIYHPYPNNIEYGTDQDDIEVMVEWVGRFLKALECVSEPYVLILEDDVRLFKPIDVTTIQGDLFGHNPNNYLPQAASDYARQFNNNITTTGRLSYGGAGGSILKTATFKHIAQQDWQTELRTYGELTKRNSKTVQSWYFNDCCLSYLCWRYGGVVCANPSLEEYYNQRQYAEKQRNGTLVIAHSYKLDHVPKK